MNYEEFLFSQLLALFDFDFAEMPYDLQYAEALTRFKDFEVSKFNIDTNSLYDCIVSYLRNQYIKQLN